MSILFFFPRAIPKLVWAAPLALSEVRVRDRAAGDCLVIEFNHHESTGMRTMHLISYCTDEPELVAVITMDEAGEITCDNADFFEDIERFGIYRPFEPIGNVFPKDRILFWEALPYEFTGMLRALEVTEWKDADLSGRVEAEMTDIRFDSHGCCLRIGDGEVSLTDKITLPMAGYTAYGNALTLHRTRDVRLVELTVRRWCWANALLPKNAAENPKLLSDEEATLALRRHFTILRQAIPNLF